MNWCWTKDSCFLNQWWWNLLMLTCIHQLQWITRYRILQRNAAAKIKPIFFTEIYFQCPIRHNPTINQMVTRCRTGDRSLSEPIVIKLVGAYMRHELRKYILVIINISIEFLLFSVTSSNVKQYTGGCHSTIWHDKIEHNNPSESKYRKLFRGHPICCKTYSAEIMPCECLNGRSVKVACCGVCRCCWLLAHTIYSNKHW